MSNFTETVKHDTPRLVIMYREVDGKEQYQWGVVGAIPIMNLIGAIVRFQAELPSHEWPYEECPESALVITWNKESGKFDWFVHPDIPVDSLVGMLETVRMTIVNTHIARQAAAQQVRLLGPDGQPFPM